MDPNDYAVRVRSGDGGDVVLRTDGYSLWLRVEGDDGRALSAYLYPDDVSELKSALNEWDSWYHNGVFVRKEDPDARDNQQEQG